MPGKQYLSEQIISQLREAEILLSQGMTVIEAYRHLDISQRTYFRWRKEYGGLDTTQARKLKDLELVASASISEVAVCFASNLNRM